MRSTSFRSAGPSKREGGGGQGMDGTLVVAVCRAGGRGYTSARERHWKIPFYNVNYQLRQNCHLLFTYVLTMVIRAFFVRM